MRWLTCMLLASTALAQDVPLAEAAKKMAAKDYAGALAEFDNAIKEAPKDASAHAGRAWALQALGRLDEALAASTRAIELKPGGAYYQQRGYLQLARGDEAAAIADFTKGIEIDPGRTILYRARADVLRGQHDYAGAIKDYTKAYEMNPADINGTNALDGRGQAKEALRDFKGAIEDYTLLCNAAPQSPRPFSQRGDVEFALGQFKEAIGDYDAAVYNDEKDSHAYVSRARAKLALGDQKGADADAAAAVEANPDADAFSDRGRYFYDTGRPKEAAKDLAQSVQMDPKGQDYTRFFLFLARAKNGERAAAAAELKAYADSREEKDDWYSKVAAFLSGQMKEDAFLAAAKTANENQTREQECESSWYAGAARLLDGDAAGAKPLLERCVATDVRNFIEYESAKMALAGMK